MSANNKAVSAVEIDPVVINYREQAQARLQEVRAFRDTIPHFAIPETRDATKRLSIAASVPPQFIELATLALVSQKGLARPDAPSQAEVYDLLSYAEAFTPLADELEALAQFVRFSVTAARNTVGSEALTTYAVAQRLAKRKENGHLVPYVEDMRRALGRGRKPSPEKVEPKAAEKDASAVPASQQS
jgi:hypothetical protein